MKDRLVTFNTNGLRNPTKRKQCFQYLKRHRADIIFLQETHCASETEIETWTKEWGGDGIWNNYRSNSRGTAILWKKSSEFIVQKISTTHEGRTIIAMLSYNKLNVMIINIYAPNSVKDRKHYFTMLTEHISKISNDYAIDSIICGGDFNCVVDSTRDKLTAGICNDSSVRD